MHRGLTNVNVLEYSQNPLPTLATKFLNRIHRFGIQKKINDIEKSVDVKQITE